MLIAPFVGYNILLVCYKQICFGLGNIKEASIQLCISYIIYFVFLVLAQLTGTLTLTFAIVASYAVNMMTVLLPILVLYRKELRWNRDSWQKIKQEQRERGWKMYLSRVIFVSSGNLDTIIVGIFHPLDSVAFFSLTKYFAMPISMLGTSVSQSIYRKLGSGNRISRSVLQKVILITVALAIAVFATGVVAVLIMGDTYLSMLSILPISIVSNAILSVNALYNSFMNAKGMADEVKNLALVGVVAKIVLNLTLIIPLGALGGVIANLAVTIIIFVLRVCYCNRYVKRTEVANLAGEGESR